MFLQIVQWSPDIEDEKHFLLNCSCYNDIRNHFFHSTDLPIDWNTLSDFRET